ncbi:MAG: CHC2 zinc finger domain-containing protein [Bacteroidota bacterium]|nr:CHC2 zinc finger domain-containing protein [Bacteroidota bacterium]
MAYHDYERINAIPIIEVCNKLDIALVKGRLALCFMHEDHRPSLTIYKNTNSWYCFPCKKGGRVIDLVKAYFNCDIDEACKWLEVEFNITPKPCGWSWKKNTKIRSTDSKLKEVGKITVESVILEWIIANTTLSPLAYNFLVNERKIKNDVYAQMNIRSLEDGHTFIQRLISHFGIQRLLDNHILSKGKYGYNLTWDAPCLLFPYYDQFGKLVNIQSRYLKTISGRFPPRFRFVKDSTTSLYNAPILNTLSYGDPILLTEGVTDALAAMSCGINAIAVAGASAFKEEYVDLLTNYTIFICPDNDNPGINLLNDIKDKMGKRFAVVKELRLADGSKDIGEYYAKHEQLRFSK